MELSDGNLKIKTNNIACADQLIKRTQKIAKGLNLHFSVKKDSDYLEVSLDKDTLSIEGEIEEFFQTSDGPELKLVLESTRIKDSLVQTTYRIDSIPDLKYIKIICK